jgi:hypothetical protein
VLLRVVTLCETKNEPNYLDVEHSLADIVTNTTAVAPQPPCFLKHLCIIRVTLGVRLHVSNAMQERVQVASSTLAREIGIISWRGKPDSPCRAYKHVAEIIRERL